MCCVLAVLVFLGPRIAFLFTWLFSDRVSLAFHGHFLPPLLGLIVLPWTSLAYVFAWAPVGGVSGIGWVVVAIGFLADISALTSGPAARRRRRR